MTNDPVADLRFPEYRYGWKNSFCLLKNLGFSPSQVLDIGANRGEWTRTAATYFPEAKYVLVEPQATLEGKIADLRASGIDVTWLTAGVGDVAGEMPLTISPDTVSSTFLLGKGEAEKFGFEQVMVPVRTADDIIKAYGIRPELVKIDAEGYDLKILAGGDMLFQCAEVIFIEAGVCATRIENTFSSVVAAMGRAGYRMFDITDINRSPRHGVIWLCELVFVRADSQMLKSIGSYA